MLPTAALRTLTIWGSGLVSLIDLARADLGSLVLLVPARWSVSSVEDGGTSSVNVPQLPSSNSSSTNR